jgi:hypothetical protein
MESFSTLFDVECGNKISKDITHWLLNTFGLKNIKVINKKELAKKRGYEPDISSCLLVSKGGSYDYDMETYTIYIHNGTLESIYDKRLNKYISSLNTYLIKYESLYFSK